MVFLQRLRPWAARLAFVVEGVGCGANDECAAGFHSDQTSKVRKAGSALDREHWRAGRTSRLVKVICNMKLLLARQDPIVTGTSRRFRDILCLLFNRDFGKNIGFRPDLRTFGEVLMPVALYLPRSGIK